jgi:hypothetical protein
VEAGPAVMGPLDKAYRDTPRPHADPVDDILRQELEQRLAEADGQASFHGEAHARWMNVSNACRAALEQLGAADKTQPPRSF